MNLIAAVDKAVTWLQNSASKSSIKATGDKLTAKVSDSEEKVLKYEREEEKARLLKEAKLQKQKGKAQEQAEKQKGKERLEQERLAEKKRKDEEAVKKRKAFDNAVVGDDPDEDDDNDDKTMKKTVLLFALLLALISCDKKSKIEKQVEEIPMEIKVVRFDKAFFETPVSELPQLKIQFPKFGYWVLKIQHSIFIL